MKKEDITFVRRMKILRKAGIDTSKPISTEVDNYDDLPELSERINKILGICNNFSHKANQMIYFVMYDIEDNKVRKYIAD